MRYGPVCLKSVQTILPARTWRARLASHRDRMRAWTRPARDRRAQGGTHPVIDFLHTYYHYSFRKLEEWHPGIGVTLESASEAQRLFPSPPYHHAEGKCHLDPAHLPRRQAAMLGQIRELLTATRDRAPNFACHGLHEWAMVYKGAEVRHATTTPLRLPPEQIDSLVASRPLCCSHFDAFRFFHPSAKPLNRLQPDLSDRVDHEQPGCLHTNMDLYKWAYKSMPWIGSDSLGDCFELAREIREVDMRASPYDLRPMGYAPIPIETAAGRVEYEFLQRDLASRAAPLRERLITALDNILTVAENRGAVPPSPADSSATQPTNPDR